jgi:hypothetical protein
MIFVSGRHFILFLRQLTKNRMEKMMMSGNEQLSSRTLKERDWISWVHQKMLILTTLPFRISLQAKIKIFVSFYQVLSTIESVYGVRPNSNLFDRWFEIFKYFEVDLFDIMINIHATCLGTMKFRLLLIGTWPFIFLLVLAMLVTIFTLTGCWITIKKESDSSTRQKRQSSRGAFGVIGHAQKKTKLICTRILKVTVILLYFMLPQVSLNIFDAIKCQAFDTNDATSETRSYLTADFSLECRTHDEDYLQQRKLFWVFFVIWPICTPIFFILLLFSVQEAVQSKHITPLAEACEFLWREYDESMMFWDVIDTLRKLFLTGFIILIDIREGSSKILRLVVVIIASALFLCALTLVRPYKRMDDLYLAVVSNMLLIGIFTFGVVIKLCEGDDSDGMCERYTSFDRNASLASQLLAYLSISFFVIAVIQMITAPTIVLASGATLHLEMPKHCLYHAFVSHTWGTGQAQTHAIVRKMQLLLPGLKFWLDVDDLKEMRNLEQYIGDSLVFIIYYSQGYFKSPNCNREVYAALAEDKPVLIIYKGDDDKLDGTFVKRKMIEECQSSFLFEANKPGPNEVYNYLFSQRDPIAWFNDAVFSAVSIRLISECIMSCLPFYQKNATVLLEGLRVPGDLGPVKMTSSIEILVCDTNSGARELAEEGRELVPVPQRHLITTHDAKSFFQDFDAMRETLPRIIYPRKVVLLLYFDLSTFQDNGDGWEVGNIIQRALDKQIPVVMIRETDPSKFGCNMDEIRDMIPYRLLRRPHSLLDNHLIYPIYTSSKFRVASLRNMLYLMRGKQKK